jgi:putative addiction module killer protein
MLSLVLIDVRQYIDKRGKNPFEKWFRSLTAEAAAKVTTVLEKMAKGNFSNVKAVGDGVSEYKLDWGPGYRIYLVRMAKRRNGTHQRLPGDSS